MTMAPKKMALIFGDVTLTFTPDDIEAVWKEWEANHPGKIADRDMPPKDFADACIKLFKANAQPTRTVLHN
jgi:hypothetical protein